MQPKKTALIGLVLTSLFLTACGGGNSSSTIGSIMPGKVLYETSTFSIQIPKEWETIDKNSFTSNVPSETIVGFRNNIKSNIFTANVNVSQKQVATELAAKDFAKSTLEILRNNLIGYQLLNESESKTNYAEEILNSYKTEFEGKKSSSEAIIHFKQIYAVNNGTSYIITAAYLPNEDESVVNTVGEMLNSFMLK